MCIKPHAAAALEPRVGMAEEEGLDAQDMAERGTDTTDRDRDTDPRGPP